MYVKIERGSCVSCGACWNTCPEIFDQNPCDEYSELVEAYRFSGNRAEGEVPEELAACAREAACLCPVEVIFVGVDNTGGLVAEVNKIKNSENRRGSSASTPGRTRGAEQ